ncbi:JmjC domain-containing histone demethylation protein 1D/E/F [Exophiala viscosa]|uniref:JmjC domain-containing histone demethylation protein 1 n=1 Tax=Exophiala viscosa TaxID=2486360 RepID=A0AAN6DR66_9EURO|nr:JmjC domain-containing histone demethylation protein 1D/E/F [Exophiala viscosa]
MPTSTSWRRSEDPSRPRGTSPERPLVEFIERLSPDPTFEPSNLPEPFNLPQPLHDSGASLRGLGLSDAGISDGPGLSLQPDHLYYDRDGAAHVGARIVSGAGAQSGRPVQDLHEWAQKSYKFPSDTRRSRTKGHTRSGSTIDDLASAAIATSPPTVFAGSYSLSRASPSAATRPSTSYVLRYNYDDFTSGPPAKRIKSERLPNLEWTPQGERPRTSGHETTPDITHEDALLLLGLKTEVNFKTKTPSLQPASLHQPDHSPSSARRSSGAWNKDGRPAEQLYTIVDGELSKQSPPQKSLKQPTTAVQVVSYHDAGTAEVDASSIQGAAASTQEPTASIHLGGQSRADGQPEHGPEPAESAARRVKKSKRLEAEVKQEEICAGCHQLQLDSDEEDLAIDWIRCDPCKRWFHDKCAGLTKAEAKSIDKFICKECESTHGKTTYVRKSSRPRAAIDYAGLNEGVVKSSAETSTHHYIQPIKEGKIPLLPDDYPRVRPELLTVEFMESFDGMKRPFVVPACWNPRFGVKPTSDETAAGVPADEDASPVAIDSNGEVVTSKSSDTLDLVADEIVDCDQDLLDMVIPRDLTVRKVAELYGPNEPVPVIDVKTQETKGQWTLGKWADYYEKPGEKEIQNVISLEVSHSPLGKLLRRPRVVRELDLEDYVWEADTETRAKKRPVQFYCLMSVADSYTDFHIDFGGSSVYYHILKGTKTFFFIPPEDKYLKKYEEWCNSDSQNETWLGELCGNNVTRVDLHEGDTAFIPAGWIHSVWTPEDSLVIGGNFLTRIDYELQLKIFNVEKATKVAAKFRYPYFQKVMWYALMRYLEQDPLPDEVVQDFRDDPDYVFLRANPVWHEIGYLENMAEPGEPAYNARHYPKAEVSGWPSLREYLYRTARIHAGLPVPDITKKQIDAVKNSIPKEINDPMLMIKLFAIWCAWKTGNVTAPEWVHSDGVIEVEKTEKSKKNEVFRLPGERTSLRKAAQAHVQAQTPPPAVSVLKPTTKDSRSGSGSNSKGNGKMACETCRKRRIKCRHKSGSETPTRPAPEIRPRSFSNTGPQPSAVLLNGSNPEPVPASEDTSAAPQVSASDSALSNDPLSSSKKGRTKACEECRKSKRRCVHDEYGRVDPAKAAEPSKPRGSTSSKRPARLSDENAPIKRARTDWASLDDLIDPALMNGDSFEAVLDAVEDDFHTPAPFADEFVVDGVDGSDDIEKEANDDPIEGEAVDTIIVDPALGAIAAQAVEVVNIKSELDHGEYLPLKDGNATDSTTPRNDSAFATPGPIKNGFSVNGDHSGSADSAPGSRQSSRQPKQVEMYTADDTRSPSKPYPKPARSDRRASSAASAQTMVTSIKSQRSSSNTSSTIHQMALMMTRRSASREASRRPVSRDSTGGSSDLDADERLARELQAAENGLRRRTSMRA